MVENFGFDPRRAFRRHLDFQFVACDRSACFSWMVGAEHSTLSIAGRLLREPRGFLLLRRRRTVARAAWSKLNSKFCPKEKRVCAI